jgi:hypothetical protein
MRQNSLWFSLALAFAFAGCGNGSFGGNDGGGGDASADGGNPDLTGGGGDLASTPGTAQMLLADVGGTAYAPAVGGGETALPFSHLMLTTQALPEVTSLPQYIDPDFSLQPLMVHGCTASRFTPTVQPAPDVNAGALTYTGYDTMLYPTDGNNTGLNPFDNPPVPSMLSCAFSTSGYACSYVGTPAAGSIAGDKTTQALYAAIPSVSIGGCKTNQTSRTVGINTVCEQHPLPTNAVVTETIAGGGDYTSINGNAPALAAPVHIITVDGAAPADATNPLASLTFGASDITIVWSCDGSSTPGSGCPTGVAGAASFVVLFATASTNPRSMFALTSSYGVAACTEQVGSSTATVTLKQAAIATLLQGQSSGGSVLVGLIHIGVTPSLSGNHNVIFSSGVGDFAFINH